MALFGAQLIYTLIMFLILSKLGKFYSLGRYLLCNKLYRYVCPGSDDLKKSIRNHYKSNNKKRNNRYDANEEKTEFILPDSVSLEVGLAQVKEQDLIYIKFTDDFQSFIDVSLITLFIYASTEVYYALFQPTNEINLSILWLGTILAYGLLTLTRITYNYMRTDEGSLVVIFAGLSFIVSLLLQLADKKLFDLNLKAAYSNLTENFNELYENYTNLVLREDVGQSQKQNINYYNNQLLYSMLLALISGFIGALLVFPSLRLAKLHLLCLKSSLDSRVKTAALYVNFLFPLFISILWFKVPKPAASEENEGRKAAKLAFYIFQSSSLKFFLIIIFFTIRVMFYRFYAQTYLNTAYEQAALLRKRTVKLTNVQFQNTIISIYKYYGVVANQYMLPMFMLLFLTLMLKTLGDLTWCDLDICESINSNIVSYLKQYSIVSDQQTTASKQSFQLFKQFESSAFNSTTTTYLSIRSVFTSLILRSLIGYLTFWTCFTSFLVSCIGLLYYQYMDRSIVQE